MIDGGARERLRTWLEYVAQYAIDWLDDLDAAGDELEDDELGDECADG
jgi:hypothetical protein